MSPRDLALSALQRRTDAELLRLDVGEFVRSFNITVGEADKLRRSVLAGRQARPIGEIIKPIMGEILARNAQGEC